MSEIIEFLALLDGDNYCPCCGDSVQTEGELCTDCVEYELCI